MDILKDEAEFLTHIHSKLPFYLTFHGTDYLESLPTGDLVFDFQDKSQFIFKNAPESIHKIIHSCYFEKREGKGVFNFEDCLVGKYPIKRHYNSLNTVFC